MGHALHNNLAIWAGSLKNVESATLFARLSILAQCIGGIGAGLNTTTVLAIVMNYFPRNEREWNIGLVEVVLVLVF